jgi:hypothetical protein
MKSGKATLTTIRPALGALAALLLAAGYAAADPVTFTGAITGSFGAGTCVTCSVDNNVVPTITASGGGGLSAIGFIGNAGSVSLNQGQGLTVTLGEFTAATTVPLGTGPNFGGSTFALNVNFTAPAGVTGASVFNATLQGQLTQSSAGVQITFTNPLLTFNSSQGVFNLLIQPTTLVVGTTGNAPLTALLSFAATPIPEPATLLLLGGGLAGIAALMKRRREEGEDS